MLECKISSLKMQGSSCPDEQGLSMSYLTVTGPKEKEMLDQNSVFLTTTFRNGKGRWLRFISVDVAHGKVVVWSKCASGENNTSCGNERCTAKQKIVFFTHFHWPFCPFCLVSPPTATKSVKVSQWLWPPTWLPEKRLAEEIADHEISYISQNMFTCIPLIYWITYLYELARERECVVITRSGQLEVFFQER